MRFRIGDAEAPLKVVGDAHGKRGTEVTFWPSTETFTKTEFDYATLEHRLRELAFLNSGVRLILTDARGVEPKQNEFHYEGGIEAFVRYLDRAKNALHEPPIVLVGEKDGITVEAAMEWTDAYHENMFCFTNNIPQRDGGTHLAGYRGALTRQINKYAEESGIAKKEKVELTGEDIREGLTCVLSVKVPDPEVLVPDQGQAGLLRGAAGGRGGGEREARPVAGRASGRCQEDRREGGGGGGCA